MSAVAIAVSFLILSMSWLGWITVAIHVLGVIFLIAAIVILLDAFWFNSGGRWTTYRSGQRVA